MMLRIKCLGLVLLLSLLGVSSEAREWGPLFEEPIRKEVIALQPDSINSDQEGTLNCFYYNGFMVKEVDTRQKGADRLSVTSIDTAKPPPC